jgi:L-ascorbate metabolism protein UlaG (beta-lactamase superfamily)
MWLGLPCALAILIGSGCGEWEPSRVVPSRLPPVVQEVRRAPGPPADLRIRRIRYATVLLELADAALLTDPWFSERRGIHQYAAEEPLGLGVADLPPLTAATCSLAHRDHCDLPLLAGAEPHRPALVVADGTILLEEARAAGFADVRPLGPWATTTIDPFRITAVPARPATAPSSREYEHGYVIEAGGWTVFFCGHLIEAPVLDEVARRWPQIDVALLPVNGLHVTILGWRQTSLDPDDAATVAARLQARIAIPIHFGFDGGFVKDTFVSIGHGTPAGFADAIRRRAMPVTPVPLAPGQLLTLRATSLARAPVACDASRGPC